ncbi:13094_t:CDS:2 [Entrophospora sp. SA101]|nr:6578_t:CDS:2 [Entrophospora sp. SA101]CAJ0747125.1 13094_t:CDS:2 [Entrophospora sp. SA101]
MQTIFNLPSTSDNMKEEFSPLAKIAKDCLSRFQPEITKACLCLKLDQ